MPSLKKKVSNLAVAKVQTVATKSKPGKNLEALYLEQGFSAIVADPTQAGEGQCSCECDCGCCGCSSCGCGGSEHPS